MNKIMVNIEQSPLDLKQLLFSILKWTELRYRKRLSWILKLTKFDLLNIEPRSMKRNPFNPEKQWITILRRRNSDLETD